MSAACTTPEFSTLKHKALRALLAGEAPETITKNCGISPRTLRSWRQQPEFQAALAQGQAELFQATCRQLASAATVAVQTLVDICQDPDTRHSDRVAAAGKLLNFLFRSTPDRTSLASVDAASTRDVPTPRQASVEFDTSVTPLPTPISAAQSLLPSPALPALEPAPLPASEPDVLAATTPATLPSRSHADPDRLPLNLDFQLPVGPVVLHPHSPQPLRAKPCGVTKTSISSNRALTLTIPAAPNRRHSR